MGHGLTLQRITAGFVKVGRGLYVMKDYCRIGESGAWLSRYKGLLPGR